MKKKILLIHHSGLIGGGSISLYYTWKALSEKYDVTCYIPNDPPDLLEFLNERELFPKTYDFRLGKITYYSGGNNLLHPAFWYHSFNAFKQFKYWKRVLSDVNPDLVIVNSKVLCWMSILFKNVKSMCFVRETILGKSDSIMNKLMNKLLEKFTIVAFLSHYDLKQSNLNKPITVVSPDFLDPKEYIETGDRVEISKKLKVNHSTFNVLFLGGINTLKGIDIGLEAINLLNDKNTNLIVAGNLGDSKKHEKNFLKKIRRRKQLIFKRSIFQYIQENKLENKVKFVGLQKNMADVFTVSDILIFPMKNPHQARPIFEIGVQSKPVIISDFPNIKEYVKDGVNGITVAPNNSCELAKALKFIQGDDEKLKSLGHNNYLQTVNYHTKEYSIGKLIDKIEEII